MACIGRDLAGLIVDGTYQQPSAERWKEGHAAHDKAKSHALFIFSSVDFRVCFASASSFAWTCYMMDIPAQFQPFVAHRKHYLGRSGG